MDKNQDNLVFLSADPYAPVIDLKALEQIIKECNASENRRWVTAIMAVTPSSGQFWYDYGKRYGEPVVMELQQEPRNGKRVCNVKVFTSRTIGDVVLSAWKEYNQHRSNK